jgi:WD40 repeat protein
VLQGHTTWVYGLAALPDGRLASGSMGDDGVICVWDVGHLNAGAPATAASTTGPPCPTCGQRTLGPLPNTGGTHLCFLCCHLIDAAARPAGALQVAAAAPAAVAGAAGGGGGGAAAAAAAGGEWEAGRAAAPAGGALVGPHPQHCVARLKHGGNATGLAVLDTGLLVSGGWDSTFQRLWNAATGESAGSMEGGQGGQIAALPAGRFAIAGYTDSSASVWDAASRTRVCELKGHADKVRCVASLPGGLVATGSSDKTVRLWTAATGAYVATLQHGRTVYALAMLPDGRLVSGGYGGGIRLWDLSTRTCTRWDVGDAVWSLAVLEGGRLASGCHEGAVHLWNTATGAREATLVGHISYVNALAALPRGLLASGSGDTTVRVWSVAARACVAVLQGHTTWVYGLAALPDGRLASGSMGDYGVICVWDLVHFSAGAPATAAGTTGPPCPTCGQRTLGPLPNSYGTHLCFLCRHLIDAAARPAGALQVAAAAPAAVGGGGGGAVAAVAAGGGGGAGEAAAAAGGAVAGPHPQHCVARLKHGESTTGLAVLDTGLLVSGGYNNTTLRLWNATTGESVGSMEGGRGARIAALPGGRFAIAGYKDSSASVWDAASRARVCEFRGHTGDANCVAALPGGLVATGSSHDDTVRLWNAATGAHVASLKHGGSVFALAVLPDGRLVSSEIGGDMRLWDIATRTCTAEWKVYDLALSLAALEGGLLASGCSCAVHLWNTASGTREATLGGHSGAVYSLAALPRGLLASGGDTTVRVWSVAARACVAVLQGHARIVNELAALPDGRLASGSIGDDGVICVWDVGHLNAGAPATAAGTTGPPCPTCRQRTLGPLPCGAHLCFLCRHIV